MNKYVHPSAVSSHVAHRTNGAQMLRDLLCTTWCQSAQPISSAASSSCQRLYYTQTTGKMGPILDHHSVDLLHTQLLKPPAMSSPPAFGFVGLFRRIITAPAS